jgi:hypothetical protein
MLASLYQERPMTDGDAEAVARRGLEATAVSYESTISRRLVHRAAVAEVLLTDCRSTGSDTFVCAAQWPRGHVLQSSRDGSFDPLLVAETIRQTGMMLAHTEYAVPHGGGFLMQRLCFTSVPEHMYAADGPLDLLVTVSVREVRRHGQSVHGLRVDTEMWSGNIRVAEGSGWLRCLGQKAYARLRRAALPDGPALPQPVAPLPAAQVGRRDPGDVVIGAGHDAQGYRLRVPMDHPVFFDHVLDHVPGMLAIEALRQAAVATIGLPGAVLTAANAQFHSFLELAREYTVVPRVVADRQGGCDLLVDIEQGQQSIVRGSVSLAWSTDHAVDASLQAASASLCAEDAKAR